MDLEELQDVFRYLLSDRFGPEMQDCIRREAAEQIKFSIRRFAAELHQIAGYSLNYAVKVAGQIVPKPVLYSMVIEYRTRGDGLLPELHLASPLQVSAYRNLQYELLAPSFIAFLFDQTIDDFNLDLREDTLVEREVQIAAQCLPTRADYYQQQIAALLDFCYARSDSECPTLEHVPTSLMPYWVLVPHICLLANAGISRSEIADVLYTVGDVLTHEHLAQLAHSREHKRFARPFDYVDSMSAGIANSRYESPARSTARAILRGQGYLMVSVSQYILQQLEFHYDAALGRYVGKLGEHRLHTPVREVITRFPAMVGWMRLYELIVRVGDDAGDVVLDQERNAPNWVNFNVEGLDALMALSSLYDIEDDNMREFILGMLHRLAVQMGSAADHNARYITARQMSSQLRDLIEVLLLLTLITSNDLLALISDSAPDESDLVEDAQSLLGIMHEVVFGSLVNAQFNDAYAEEMGAGMSNAA
jgi:hypothetical protein